MRIAFDVKYKDDVTSGRVGVVNNKGDKVRIICWDVDMYYPIVGAIAGVVRQYNNKGVCYNESSNLFIDIPDVEKGMCACFENGTTPFVISDVWKEQGRYERTYLDGTKGIGKILDFSRHYRRWSVGDAKDGDVLVTDDAIFLYEKNICAEVFMYCVYYIKTDKFVVSTTATIANNIATENIRPATNVERNVLFQKMHEAGYEWDDEKMELHRYNDLSHFEKQYSILHPLMSDSVVKEQCEILMKTINTNLEKDFSQKLDEQYKKGFIAALNTLPHWNLCEEQPQYQSPTIVRGDTLYHRDYQISISALFKMVPKDE